MNGNLTTIVDAPKVYDIADVMQIVSVSQRTIYRYIKDGKLKATRIGKKYIISDENLRKFLNGEKA